MGFTRDPTQRQIGVPVYGDDGALLAESISAAARLLGCDRKTIRRHVVDHRDGLRLLRVLRRHPGQPNRPARAYCLTPDGRTLLLTDYAAECGVTHQALRGRRGSYQRADDVWVVAAPLPSGRPRKDGE
jgi:hypothetical protein